MFADYFFKLNTLDTKLDEVIQALSQPSLLKYTFFRLGRHSVLEQKEAILQSEKQVQFWKISVEALEEFPIVIIQSRNSASTHEYSENCRARIAQQDYVMIT